MRAVDLDRSLMTFLLSRIRRGGIVRDSSGAFHQEGGGHTVKLRLYDFENALRAENGDSKSDV